MSFVAVAIGGSAIVGGVVAAKSASNANKTTQQATAANNALQSQIYEQNRTTLAPYVQAGNRATNSIQALLGLGGTQGQPTYEYQPGMTEDYNGGMRFTPGQQVLTGYSGGQTSQDAARAAFDQYRGSTGYDFRLSEGNKSMSAALGRGNMLESGAAVKSAIKFGQNTASDEFSRYLDALRGQQLTGLTGASAQAGVGNTFATNTSANNNAAANAAGNASIATGNAVNQALGGITSAVGYGAGLGSSYGGAGSYRPPADLASLYYGRG